MKKLDPDNVQKNVERKAAQRDRKKHPRMKVSGTSARMLQKIIIEKGRDNPQP